VTLPFLTLLIALSAASRPPVATPAPKAPAPKADAPIYDPISDGRRQIEAGARVAAASGKRLLLDFGVNDCEPCRVVNRALHAKLFLDAFVNEFVLVFIDVSPGGKNASLPASYGIDRGKGLPAVVIFDDTMKPGETTKQGELVEVAKKGESAVQEWFLARFSRP